MLFAFAEMCLVRRDRGYQEAPGLVAIAGKFHRQDAPRAGERQPTRTGSSPTTAGAHSMVWPTIEATPLFAGKLLPLRTIYLYASLVLVFLSKDQTRYIR